MSSRALGLAAAHVLFYMLVALVLLHLQGVLWFQFFGAIPSPALWLLPVVYLAQKPTWVAGILQTYAICLLVATATVMPIGILMASSGLVYLSCFVFRGRIFWEGLSYQVLIAAVAALSFQIYQILLSWMLEPIPIVNPNLFFALGQVILTGFLGPLFYLFFAKCDGLLGFNEASELAADQTQII